MYTKSWSYFMSPFAGYLIINVVVVVVKSDCI